MTQFNHDHKTVWDQLPLSVNDTYGDPYFAPQVDNTVEKLNQLRNHQSPVATFTKAPYDKNVINKLAAVRDVRPLVLYYSLTGMNEGGISFESRLQMIDALQQTFQRPVVVFTRPIIAGKNDDDVTLLRLAHAAQKSGYLVLGGLHDKYRRKHIKKSVEERLIGFCDELGVKSFYKTCCAAAHLQGVKCWMHDLGKPQHTDVVAKLGYKFSIVDSKIELETASTGDLNFLRMLTRSEVGAKHIVSNYNVLSLSTTEKILEAHSSWTPWSKNLSQCIGCGYCIILQIEYLMKKQIEIGMSPLDWKDFAGKSAPTFNFAQLQKTKTGQEISTAKTYKDLRVVQPCFTNRYKSSAEVAATKLGS